MSSVPDDASGEVPTEEAIAAEILQRFPKLLQDAFQAGKPWHCIRCGVVTKALVTIRAHGYMLCRRCHAITIDEFQDEDFVLAASVQEASDYLAITDEDVAGTDAKIIDLTAKLDNVTSPEAITAITGMIRDAREKRDAYTARRTMIQPCLGALQAKRALVKACRVQLQDVEKSRAALIADLAHMERQRRVVVRASQRAAPAPMGQPLPRPLPRTTQTQRTEAPTNRASASMPAPPLTGRSDHAERNERIAELGRAGATAKATILALAKEFPDEDPLSLGRVYQIRREHGITRVRRV